jgi:hypothetical protein
MMRRAIIALALSIALPCHASAGGDWNFRVTLDGREIGSHRYTLEPGGQGTVLRSQADFDVRFLFVTAYRYDHEAVERWQDGCLRALDSRTDSNGEVVAVNAVAGNDGLAVARPEGRDVHPGCIRSFAYWDRQLLESDRLLNSQTGELVPVQVTSQGQERVRVRGDERVASRYRISGPNLQIDVWYADGDWVGLEALTDGGRRLRYELR